MNHTRFRRIVADWWPRVLRGPWPRRRKQRPLRQAAERIGAAQSKLLGFGTQSDHEFTELARRIADVAARLANVRQATSAMERVAAGGGDDDALAAARQIHRGCADLVRSSLAITSTEEKQLRDVKARLLSVAGAQAQFKRNSIMYRLLAMGIRMEAARLEAQDQITFGNVASAIADIERQMTETTERAFAQIADVVADAAAEGAQLAALHAVLHQRAESSIRAIDEELDRARSALAPCATQTQAIGAGLAETAGHIARLTTALQYQDIVRQKLQHVAQGFDDLSAHLHGDAGKLDPAYVQGAAQLQRAQLRAARKDIDRAATTITGEMGRLLGATQELVAQFQTMHDTAATVFGHCRVATLFREETSKLADTVGQSERNHETIARLVDRIEHVVNLFARDVGAHQFDVLLVSLNAQVAAARLPSADALNKLAEEAIRLSAENAGVTDALASNLADTLGQLAEIKANAKEFLALVQREKSVLDEGSRAVTVKLESLIDRTRKEAAGVNRDFSTLYADVAQLIDGLSFPRQIESAWAAAEEVSDQFVALTAGAREGAADAAAAALLEAHRARYTMIAEHDAHTAAVAAKPPSPSRPESAPTPIADHHRNHDAAPEPAPTPATAAAPSEFGDGIELF